MLRKLLICPYFGPFPEWMDLFIADFMRTMKPQGYSILIDTDLPAFKERVRAKLGIEFPGVRGSGKVWDYRGALGLLYEDEIKSSDYWGHCDMDVVWGNVSKFIPDEKLSELDIYSGHREYVNGCFSLYRNTSKVNMLFQTSRNWKENMIHLEPNGWIETEFSRTLEQSGLKYLYDFNQGNPWDNNPVLRKDSSGLFQKIGEEWFEIAFFHFRHSKRWPL